MLRTLMIPALFLASTSIASAAGPHEHGVGNMNVVLDGKALLIELEIPGADVVGFEHKPKTEEQQRAVDMGFVSFKEPDQLFAMTEAAACVFKGVQVESDLSSGDDEDGDHGHDHKEHGHEHEHDDHAHDDHGHGHDDHGHDDHGHDDHAHGDEEAHGSYRATYDYLCDAPAALEGIETKLFNVFPTLEKIRTQSVGPKGQSSGELTREAAVLGL